MIKTYITTAIAALALSLSACASNHISNQFESGKTAFQQKQYNDAFSSLMPAAKKGNPAAEYAIGYMYFYGKGVTQNTVLAQQWFAKAAKKHYPQAQAALNLLAQQLQAQDRVFSGPVNQLMKR
jgi:TPR repeat protein